jgi:hypothetical protein
MKKLVAAALVAAFVVPGAAQGKSAEPVCKTKACKARVLKKHKQRVVRPFLPALARLAYCEATGRYYISTGNGYHGAFQFDAQTWHSVGGRGLPHQNSKLEQRYRAVLLFKKRGWRPWPVCGPAAWRGYY